MSILALILVFSGSLPLIIFHVEKEMNKNLDWLFTSGNLPNFLDLVQMEVVAAV